jgi:hypothetical protein
MVRHVKKPESGFGIHAEAKLELERNGEIPFPLEEQSCQQ